MIGCSASLVFSLLHACLSLLGSTPLHINKGASAYKYESLDTLGRFISRHVLVAGRTNVVLTCACLEKTDFLCFFFVCYFSFLIFMLSWLLLQYLHHSIFDIKN